MAGEKILIIEDNPMNMELVTDLLEVSGYVVFQATTAEEGIELAKQRLPSLILMDIGLPDMDGLTATTILKEQPATQHIIIVALTAHAMKGDQEKALEAGCKTHITKPIDTRQFLKEIIGILDGNGEERKSPSELR